MTPRILTESDDGWPTAAFEAGRREGVFCPRCGERVGWINRDTLLCASCSDDEDVTDGKPL